MRPAAPGLLAGLVFLLLSWGAQADEVSAAVAANFTAPMKRIAADFERLSGHAVKLSFGATGAFHAQISNGAPFDVLLAADQNVPAQLIQEGRAVQGSQFTYAVGRLVLWSTRPGLVDGKGEVLFSADIAHVAYCNPKLAPYGAAAVEAMRALGVFESLRPKLVQGESITQAFQFVASGSAEVGFVALSQVYRDGAIAEGSAWILPAGLYSPIRQDAVLLAGGREKAAAKDLLAYLRSDPARAVMRSFGYE